MPFACPAEQTLARMLEDLLVDGEAEAVESHVATCRDCQRTLERLTAEGGRDTYATWAGPPATGAFDPLTSWDGHATGIYTPNPASETTDGGPPPRTSGTAPAGSSLPEVPGYRIERELGRGGMGIVYLARQDHANRMVALKMVLADRGRPEDLLRFLIEGESLARLQHPNIVQVHEVGQFRGRPYFSMEYVDGGTLADLLAGTSPTPRESATLVETLARAVHAAHQSGVVHRDLKPANILLAAKPKSDVRRGPIDSWDGQPPATPKVTDFGLAKHVGIDSGLTQTGQILGTPSYMAPEQATGGASVGVPADVYSLGAILYEMLAGRPPFKAASAWETMMQVAHEAVVPPSRRRPGLPRDLEVICLKCLGKAPADRYPSADALAEDLRRFLAGEPILARPVGPARRTAMWCRRHPAYATMVTLLLASIALGVAGVAIQWRRAEVHLAASRRRLDLALGSISAFYTGVSEDVLLKQPEMEALRADLLRTPLEFYRRLRDELEATGGADRPARLQLVDALIKLGRLTQEVGVLAEAEASFRQATGVANGLVAEDPGDRAAARLLAWSRANSGKIAAISGKLAEARVALGEADALFERFAREDPGDPEDANGRGFCRHFLGDVACDEGHFAESEGHYKASIALRRGLVERGQGPAGDYLDQLGGTANNLGEMHARARQLAEAERAFRESVGYRRRLSELLPASTPHRASLASSLSNLAELYYDRRRNGEARAYLGQTVAIQERIVAEHGAVPRYRAELAATYYRLGQLLEAAGRQSRARADYVRAAEEMARLSATDPAVAIWRETQATMLYKLGDSFEEDGMRPEATAAYAGALQALDRPPVVATAEASKVRSALLARSGASLRKAGRQDAADAAFASALAAAGGKEAGTDSRSEIAKVLLDLSAWELRRRDPGWSAHALADARRAAALLEASDDDESRLARVDALNTAARALAALGRPGDALMESDRAKALAGGDADASLVASAARAEVLAASGRLDAALAAAEEAEAKFAAATEDGSNAEMPLIAFRLARAFAAAAGSPAAESPAARAEHWLARSAAAAAGEARAILRDLEAPAFDAVRDRPATRASTLDLSFPAEAFID